MLTLLECSIFVVNSKVLNWFGSAFQAPTTIGSSVVLLDPKYWGPETIKWDNTLTSHFVWF